MLRVRRRKAQELHHSADRHFLQHFQRLTVQFYLIIGVSAVRVGAI